MLEHLVGRGYTPGSGVISPEGVFCLHIPKNASTYLTNLLVNNGWLHTHINDSAIVKQIVVLRDPVERWVSGFATYAASWVLGPSYGSDNFNSDFNELTERVIFDQLVFDDHTTPQIEFVNQLNTSLDTTCFALNRDLKKNLESYLGTELVSNEELDRNATENNYDTKQIAKKMAFVLSQNPLYKAKVVEKYRDDYALICRTNFYNYYNESR